MHVAGCRSANKMDFCWGMIQALIELNMFKFATKGNAIDFGDCTARMNHF